MPIKSRDHSTVRGWVVADNLYDGGNGINDGERIFGESVLLARAAGNSGGSSHTGFDLTGTSNDPPASGPFTSVPALRIDDTTDHVINATESNAVTFEVSGLTSGATGTVTFTDSANHEVVVNVGANGSYSADLSTLADGTIGSSLAATSPSGGTGSATGNAITLDTDRDLTPTFTYDSTDPSHVVFTIAGLEGDEHGAVTFTDVNGQQDVVNINSNGTYSTNLSNLAAGTITYLVEATDPAGNTISFDPPINLGDGSANAPAGAAQMPTLLSGYAVRPTWNVAGVDYHVGVTAGTVLKDPSTINMAGVSVDRNSHIITVTGNNVTLDGYDFSLTGGWQLTIAGSATNTTISNDNFKVGSNLWTPIEIWGATNTTIQYCNIDGSGLNNDSGFGLIQSNGIGTTTIQYNYIHDAWHEDIVAGNTTTSVANYNIQYNLIGNAGEGHPIDGSHGDWIQVYNPTAPINNLQINFNTWFQTVPVTQGLSLQSAAITQKPVVNETVENNTLISTGTPPNWSTGYMIIVDTTNLSGTATVSDNYIDQTNEAYGAFYIGAYNGVGNGGHGSYNGTVIDFNNVNMVTGAYYGQSITSVQQVTASPSTGTEFPGNTITLTLKFTCGSDRHRCTDACPQRRRHGDLHGRVRDQCADLQVYGWRRRQPSPEILRSPRSTCRPAPQSRMRAAMLPT